MKCSKCGNTSDFNIFLDHLFKVKFRDKELDSVEEAGSDFAQIYPIFCEMCGNMGVEFDYKELEEIRSKIKAEESNR